MKRAIRVKLLGFYDLILAIGSIWIGIMMVNSSGGIFVEYPDRWASRLPFDSWVIPGVSTLLSKTTREQYVEWLYIYR